MRGFLWGWVWDWDNTPETLDAMLDVAEAGRFRTVLYYVGCGTALYDSALLPSYGLEHDSLAYVIEQAHARGLRVEPWWCPGEAPSESAFRDRYPTWDVATVPGIPDYAHWLNFSLPEVRQFVSDVVLELAGYEVDGVHLDYIRYPSPPPWGAFDPAEFFDPTDVPKTVALCYQRLKASDPSLPLTAAVMSGLGSSEGHLQNWADWLAGEYIDRVLTMAYFAPADNATLERDLGYWQGLPGFGRIVPGLATDYDGTVKTAAELMEQVAICQNGGVEDIAIFSSMGAPEDQWAALANHLAGPAWYIAPYKRREDEDKPIRYCAMDNYTAGILESGGWWSETEVLGDRAIVKVRASGEMLATLDGVFKRLPFDHLGGSLASLTIEERSGLVGEMLDMGYSGGEITNALGDLQGGSLGDVLDFMATRRLQPRYDAQTDQIILDGPAQACRPVARVEAMVDD